MFQEQFMPCKTSSVIGKFDSARIVCLATDELTLAGQISPCYHPGYDHLITTANRKPIIADDVCWVVNSS